MVSAAQADSYIQPRPAAQIPNYFGIGIGGAPDYMGSDDTFYGAAPVARYNFNGYRYLSLEGNYASINLANDPNWEYGLAGLYRFGRDNDIDDRVVRRMSEIDDTVELGAFVGYQVVGPNDPRDRWRIGGDILFDVGDTHDGYVASASIRRWLPIGQYGTLGLGGALSYGSDDYMDTYFSVDAPDALASGLPGYDADGGLRDARLMAIYIQPINRHWVVGGGVLYSRLLGDAKDTPITDIRGDADQFIFGVGVGRLW